MAAYEAFWGSKIKNQMVGLDSLIDKAATSDRLVS